MVDFRDYVSFEMPVGVTTKMPQFPDSEIHPLKGDDLALVKKGLKEIAETPEGLGLLQRVASQFSDGKVPILHNVGGRTVSGPFNIDGRASKVIMIGTTDSDERYYSPEIHAYNDVSIQRALFHELQHFDLGHIKVRSKDTPDNVKLARETEAILKTNEFMSKYYSDPVRSENPKDIDDKGRDGWEDGIKMDPQDFSIEAEPKTGLDGWLNKLPNSFGTSAKPPDETSKPTQQYELVPQGLEP